jgi:hypothetical protein
MPTLSSYGDSALIQSLSAPTVFPTCKFRVQYSLECTVTGIRTGIRSPESEWDVLIPTGRKDEKRPSRLVVNFKPRHYPFFHPLSVKHSRAIGATRERVKLALFGASRPADHRLSRSASADPRHNKLRRRLGNWTESATSGPPIYYHRAGPRITSLSQMPQDFWVRLFLVRER